MLKTFTEMVYFFAAGLKLNLHIKYFVRLKNVWKITFCSLDFFIGFFIFLTENESPVFIEKKLYTPNL